MDKPFDLNAEIERVRIGTLFRLIAKWWWASLLFALCLAVPAFMAYVLWLAAQRGQL